MISLTKSDYVVFVLVMTTGPAGYGLNIYSLDSTFLECRFIGQFTEPAKKKDKVEGILAIA